MKNFLTSSLIFCFIFCSIKGFSQSNEISFKNLEYLITLDKLGIEDNLFLKGYKKVSDIDFGNWKSIVYSRGKNAADFSEISLTTNEQNVNYSVVFATYSELKYDELRKGVILSGYTRKPDDKGFVLYANSKYRVDLTMYKDDDGNLKYSINLVNKVVKNPLLYLYLKE
jgi:hypothetical protein